jgi:outer membrane lipoprotein-sorting protein
MKSLAVVLLIALAAFGVVAGANAQSGNSPAGTQPPAATAPSSDSSSASGSVSTPSGETKGQVTIERKSESKTETRTDSGKSDDGASALPRTVVSERTTVFGLSPTAAVVIAAALLVVVILAIVAMTRSNDTYIER